jgi:hypothetical protein
MYEKLAVRNLHSVTIKFQNCSHKNKKNTDEKYVLIPSFNMVAARFGATFVSLIQRIECQRKRFFQYRLQFSRHILLDR